MTLALVVGVDESTDPPTPAQIPLAGLQERVDQVGRSRVDPPLLVTCKEIPATGTPGEGYLVILVPASPMAPHMVDHIYRGRGDTTNVRLSDAEVRRIRDQRRQGVVDIQAILEAEIERDPINGQNRENGHLFVVAEPVFSDPEMLLPVAGDKWREWLHATFRTGAPRLTPDWGPDISSAMRVVRGPRGWTMRSWDGERTNAADNVDEDGQIELQVLENGGLRLFSARATDTANGTVVVIDALVFGLVYRVVDWACAIAAQTSLVGNWRFAVALTRIAGARSHAVRQRGFLLSGTPYDGDGYEAWTEASHADLVNDPNRVVERLVGRLNRALSEGTTPLPRRA